MILAVVFPRGTIPSSATPFFHAAFPPWAVSPFPFYRLLWFFFARFDLHFSQVISFRSVIVPALRYLVTLSAFSRMIPQPVFLSFSVPWTKSLPTAVIKVISIRFSKPKGRNHQRSPLYGSGRPDFPAGEIHRHCMTHGIMYKCTQAFATNIIQQYYTLLFQKNQHFLKIWSSKLYAFQFFWRKQQKVIGFFVKNKLQKWMYLHKIPYKLCVLCKNIFLNIPVRRCLHLVNILCLNTPAAHYFMQT